MAFATPRMLCTLLIAGYLQSVSGAVFRHSEAGKNQRFLGTQPASSSSAAVSPWPAENSSSNATNAAAVTTSTTPQQATDASNASAQASASTTPAPATAQAAATSPTSSPTSPTSSQDQPATSAASQPTTGASSQPATSSASQPATSAAASQPASPTAQTVPDTASAPNTVSSSYNTLSPVPPTLAPPCEETVATAPMAGVPTFNDMFSTNSSACKCNCTVKLPDTAMNNSAVLHQLMNVAHLSADAAQSAIDYIDDLGLNASTGTAKNAEYLANQANQIWSHNTGRLQRVEAANVAANMKLKAMTKFADKAANGYDYAIQEAKVMSPVWPPNLGSLSASSTGTH